jgi:hypothetical protein
MENGLQVGLYGPGGLVLGAQVALEGAGRSTLEVAMGL